jgi:DNA-binding NarL/FixJ family response regulator
MSPGTDQKPASVAPIRVAIIDDHPVVRQGLHSLLSQFEEIELVGEAGDRSAAINLVVEEQPDVILLDIRLKEESGLEIAQNLRRIESPARIIILTSYEDKNYLLKAAQAGVHGYLLKSTSPEMLLATIQAVQNGERRLSPEVGGKAIEQLEELGQKIALAKAGLSEQELQLLQLLADGASTQDMIDVMYLSESTIKRKIQDIVAKLGASNRTQAVAEAYKRTLL